MKTITPDRIGIPVETSTLPVRIITNRVDTLFIYCFISLTVMPLL